MRNVLGQKASTFDHTSSKIASYWKTTLFDIGVETSVIEAIASHSFNWVNIIPMLAERKLAHVYTFIPTSASDQSDALDKLVMFVVRSVSSDSSVGRDLRESLTADGFRFSTASAADSKLPEELSKLPNAEAMRVALAGQLKAGLVALLFIDLDNFKSVNDTLGHEEGNQCLLRAIRMMSTAILSKGKLYRWGGDEFAIILPNFSSSEAAATAERIRAALDDTSPGGTIKVTASIGVATSQSSGVSDAKTLEKSADTAMYDAKKRKNTVAVAA